MAEFLLSPISSLQAHLVARLSLDPHLRDRLTQSQVELEFQARYFLLAVHLLKKVALQPDLQSLDLHQ